MTDYITHGSRDDAQHEPDEGEAFTLTVGSSASFNDGSRSRWTIRKPVVEFFVYS